MELTPWLSIEKSIPEEMREVIVFDEDKGVFIGHYFQSANSFIRTVDGARLSGAKYWMPIPELP